VTPQFVGDLRRQRGISGRPIELLGLGTMVLDLAIQDRDLRLDLAHASAAGLQVTDGA
jgi:hypothetical protein